MTRPVPFMHFSRRAIDVGRPAAVYSVFDSTDELVYVGVGYDPGLRVGHHKKNAPWGGKIASWSAVWYESRAEADIAETLAIAELQPRYNIAGTPLHREMSLGIRPASHRGLVAYDRELETEGKRHGYYWSAPASEARTGEESDSFLRERAYRPSSGPWKPTSKGPPRRRVRTGRAATPRPDIAE